MQRHITLAILVMALSLPSLVDARVTKTPEESQCGAIRQAFGQGELTGRRSCKDAWKSACYKSEARCNGECRAAHQDACLVHEGKTKPCGACYYACRREESACSDSKRVDQAEKACDAEHYQARCAMLVRFECTLNASEQKYCLMAEDFVESNNDVPFFAQ